MNKLRRFLTIGVMAITVLATVGAYVPAQASASAGDLIKMDGLSSVYYLGSDGKRYVFPNTATYMSWYNDFSGVVTIPASELQSYPLGGNVTMRPGTKLVKITTDPSVYAVEPNGVLRKIQSEAQASALYGTNWNKRVVDVADAFFTNYTISSALPSGSVPAGSLVKSASAATVYYFDGSNYRAIADESAFNANRFNFSNVITVSSIATTGTAVSSAEFVNVAQNGATTGTVVTGSGLMVSLNANTPAAISVPGNGTRVPMAKVNLTAASDGAVTVNTIVIKRIGLSSADQIDKVWAEKDGITIASKKDVNSSDIATLSFSPALTVNAGQTVSIDLIASLSGATSGNIGLEIESASSVSATSAAVTGSFPIKGNLMSPTDYKVSELYLDSSKGVTNTDINVGDAGIELGKFNVNFVSGTAKDVTLNSVSLKNTGDEDLSSSVANVYLENKGNKVATGVIDGKYINFTFTNGFALTKNNGTQTFYVKGDVTGKQNSGASQIVLTLNKDTDFVGQEVATGFGVKFVKNSAEAAFEAYTVSTLTLKSGDVTVSKKSTSPSDSNVTKNTKGIVALIANVNAKEAINADGLYLNIDKDKTTANATSSFENVKVYVNGTFLDSFDLNNDDYTAGYHLLDSSFDLKQGDNEVKVTVDTTSDASSTATLALVLKGQYASSKGSLESGEYDASGNTVSADQQSGTAQGAKLSIKDAGLSAVRSDGYATAKSIVKGSTDVSLGKFTLKASDDTVKITQINIASTTGNTISANNVYDMKLFIDGTQVGTTKDFTTSGASFSSLNISIADNQTKTLEVKGSFDSASDTSSYFAGQLSFTAEDSNGKSISTDTPSTTNFAIVGNGSLNIAKDGNSAVSNILSSKAGVEQEVATYKLTATNDSANLTELVLVNSGDGSATSTVSTADPRIASYKLYVEGNSTAIDTETPVSGSVKFVLSGNQVVVPADGSKKIIVKAVLNDISNDATATDKPLRAQINSYKFKSSNGDETATTGVAYQGNQFYIRKTAPTVTLVALPNTTLTTGSQTVSKFTIAADSNADVKVAKIAIKYATTTNVDLATSTSPVKINGTSKSAGTDNVTESISGGYIIVDFGTSTPEIVSAGTSKTFEIVSNVTVSGSDSRSLTTSIEEASHGTVTSGNYSATNNLTWTDSASNNDANNVWFNSYRVKGLPSDTQTLSIN